MKRWLIITVSILILGGGIAAGIWYYRNNSADSAVSYRTAKVQSGDLVAGINATGTIEPEEVINVGAQIAGQILSFGKDRNGKTIDYGSEVEEGTVLARIDDIMYAAEQLQAEAQVRLAQASALRAEADLKQMAAKLDLAQRDWARAQKLRPSQALAESAYDSFKSALDAAIANKAVGEAAILQAKATQASSEAMLQKAQRNLSYCTIKSPVNGIVIDRRVNIGQTVVASLNAPSLFLIAKDLKRMQVWVSVNEADIGKISPGQPVTFTVDAFPDEVFKGEVGKIRLNASMTQNVVTFTVEVITDNSSGRLLPYLTASVQFEQARRSDVLQVANAALRWTPKPEQISPQFQNQPAANGETPEKNKEKDKDKDKDKGKKKRRDKAGEQKAGLVWVQDGDHVKPLKVNVGITNGSTTEVSGDEIRDGMEIIVGQRIAEKGASATTNPFTPQIGNRRR
ncbi:MAG: efflux RND transporter periplasmic adaptor subunit [Victivallaceae bacterium]|jgi:HlyD family secretion protein